MNIVVLLPLIFLNLYKTCGGYVRSTVITGQIFGLVHDDLLDVSITINGGLKRIKIDTRGSYIINDLTTGNYVLKISHPKYEFHDVLINIDENLDAKFSHVDIYRKSKPVYFNKLYSSPINNTNTEEEYNAWLILRKPYVLFTILFILISNMRSSMNYRNWKNQKIAKELEKKQEELYRIIEDAHVNDDAGDAKESEKEEKITDITDDNIPLPPPPKKITSSDLGDSPSTSSKAYAPTRKDALTEISYDTIYGSTEDQNDNCKNPVEETPEIRELELIRNDVYDDDEELQGNVVQREDGYTPCGETTSGQKASKLPATSDDLKKTQVYRDIFAAIDPEYIDNLRQALITTVYGEPELEDEVKDEDSDFNRPFMRFIRKSAIYFGRMDYNWRCK